METFVLEVRASGTPIEFEATLRHCLRACRYEVLDAYRDVHPVVEIIKVSGSSIALTAELLQLGDAIRERGGSKQMRVEVTNEKGDQIDLLTAEESAVSRLLFLQG